MLPILVAIKSSYDFPPPISHRFQVMVHHWSNFR